VIVGHVMGIPVEEVILQFVPVAAATVTLTAIAGRTSLNLVRRRLRRQRYS
jgi:hypothetical protein